MVNKARKDTCCLLVRAEEHRAAHADPRAARHDPSEDGPHSLAGIHSPYHNQAIAGVLKMNVSSTWHDDATTTGLDGGHAYTHTSWWSMMRVLATSRGVVRAAATDPATLPQRASCHAATGDASSCCTARFRYSYSGSWIRANGIWREIRPDDLCYT